MQQKIHSYQNRDAHLRVRIDSKCTKQKKWKSKSNGCQPPCSWSGTRMTRKLQNQEEITKLKERDIIFVVGKDLVSFLLNKWVWHCVQVCKITEHFKNTTNVQTHMIFNRIVAQKVWTKWWVSKRFPPLERRSVLWWSTLKSGLKLWRWSSDKCCV